MAISRYKVMKISSWGDSSQARFQRRADLSGDKKADGCHGCSSGLDILNMTSSNCSLCKCLERTLKLSELRVQNIEK